MRRVAIRGGVWSAIIAAAAVGGAGLATEAGAQGGMMHHERGRGMMGMEAARLPELLPENLPDPESEGADLTVRYCAQCHNLPSPALHSAEEWIGVMNRMDHHMSRGMHRRGEMEILRPTAEERAGLLQYLQKNALQTFSGPALPDSESPGAGRFKEICARCHALPDPGLHSAEEWPAVVDRMRGNMKVMGKPDITDAERTEISDYLRRHAGRGGE